MPNPTEQALTLLKSERDRLDAAIRLIEGTDTGKRRGRPRNADNVSDWVKPKRKARKFTSAQRKQQSLRMKKQWAERREAKAGKKKGG